MAGKLRGMRSYKIDYAKAARKIVDESRILAREEDLDKPTAILAVLLRKMNFSEERAVIAARKRGSIAGALQYLKSAEFRQCPLCTCDVELEAVVSLEPCGHEACKSCCKNYFEVKIREEASIRLVCFTCSADVDAPETLPLLRKLLSRNDYELLEKKLLEFTLTGCADFKYCTECGYGFYNNPDLKRAQCPKCNVVICAKCWTKWDERHRNVSCEDFKKWKQENDPDYQAAGMEKILREDGICCPQCKKLFHMARGGCLHFKCTACSYQFCMGCGSKFSPAEECAFGMEDCAKRGFHAHHPRNCFYYVRDLGSAQELLDFIKADIEDSDIRVNEDVPEAQDTKCRRVVTDDSMKDSRCHGNAYKADLCEPHYKEYLADFIFKNGIDPVPLMSVDQLKCELQRNKKLVPSKRPNEEEDTFACRLREIVENSIPVKGREQSE